jgi:hypothetical protein
VKTGALSQVPFQLTQTFFGFDASDRVQLHDTIFNLIWHGDGRWDWDTIYNMPIFLRKFYIKRVNKILEEREEAAEQQREAASKRKSSRNSSR